MDYRKKYTLDPSFIQDGSIKWESTGSGVFALGTYKGQSYFIKRFTMGPRIPASTIPEPVRSEMMATAKWLEGKQADMRKRMSGLTVDADHIVVEEENFWDDDNIFVTITRMIPNENKDFDYTTLDQATFTRLCVDMVTLLKKIHDVGVTHGDLKEKNILIQRNGSDLIPYLIDFDSSYPSDYGTKKRADGKPCLSYPVVYSEGYQSPEIAIYNFEDEGVIDAATITDKTDIFTMALIIHRLWTGDFPAVVGDDCAVGEAVYLDEEIQISSKLDVELGSTNGCKLIDLVRWMLQKDPAARPTADQVIDALEDRLDISDFYSGSSSGVFDTEPHELHKNAVDILPKEELKKLNLQSFRKGTVGGQQKYLVKMKDGTEMILTVDEIIAKGFGVAKSTSIGTLWPADDERIEFMPIADIAAQGVLKIEPREVAPRKFYFVAMRDGRGYTTSASGLVARGLAQLKTVTYPESQMDDSETPWPEHGTAYDVDALSKRNIIKVEKLTEGGENKYRIHIKKDDGSTAENVVKGGYMRIMKFIK